MTLNITALCIEWHYAEWHYAEWHYAEWHYAEWHYAEWHYAVCQDAFIVILNAIMLSDTI